MNRDIWTINNENFELLLDASVDDNKLTDKKFSIGHDLWTNEIPSLKFNDENAQKEYENFVSDLVILFTEPTVNEIFIDAKIGEESEYNQKGISQPVIIRKIEEYIVDEIIE